MVYGELGRLPLSIAIKLSHLNRMITGKKSKGSRIMYNCLKQTCMSATFLKGEKYLYECGLQYVWDFHQPPDFYCGDVLYRVNVHVIPMLL